MDFFSCFFYLFVHKLKVLSDLVPRFSKKPVNVMSFLLEPLACVCLVYSSLYLPFFTEWGHFINSWIWSSKYGPDFLTGFDSNNTEEWKSIKHVSVIIHLYSEACLRSRGPVHCLHKWNGLTRTLRDWIPFPPWALKDLSGITWKVIGCTRLHGSKRTALWLFMWPAFHHAAHLNSIWNFSIPFSTPLNPRRLMDQLPDF